jgi:hypothetical protein
LSGYYHDPLTFTIPVCSDAFTDHDAFTYSVITVWAVKASWLIHIMACLHHHAFTSGRRLAPETAGLITSWLVYIMMLLHDAPQLLILHGDRAKQLWGENALG